MSPFAAAHASGADVEAVLRQCLDGLEGRTGGHDLGFVYFTDHLAPNAERIAAELRSATGVERWVGAAGIGVCASGTEYWDEPAAVVLTGRFGEDGAQVFAASGPMLQGVAGVLDGWRDARTPLFAVVHLEPGAAGPVETVAALSAWMPDGFLAGGLASSRHPGPAPLLPASPGGLSGVLFAGDVAVATRLSQGCTPIGPRHAVTAADGNVLVELDGRPALDVFREDIGEVLARDLARVGGYIFAGLPVAHADTGDYLVRNLLGLDEARGLLAIGDHVQAGGQVLFCKRDAHTARDDLLRMLDEIRAAVGERRPRGGLYFSCLARGPSMFGQPSAEMAVVREVLGDIPLAGFFANGEVSHDRLYTYTGVLTLFL